MCLQPRPPGSSASGASLAGAWGRGATGPLVPLVLQHAGPGLHTWQLDRDLRKKGNTWGCRPGLESHMTSLPHLVLTKAGARPSFRSRVREIAPSLEGRAIAKGHACRPFRATGGLGLETRRFKEGMMAVSTLPSAVLGPRKWAVLGAPRRQS